MGGKCRIRYVSQCRNGPAQDHPCGKGEHVLQNKDREMEAILTLETLSSAGPVESLIAYSEQCQIRDLQRRRYSFGTRDQA